MIPAMMPASDDEPPPSISITPVPSDPTAATINYDGGSMVVYTIGTLDKGLYWDGEIKRTTNQNLSAYDSGSTTSWKCPAGNNLVVIGNIDSNDPEMSYVRYADFDSASAGTDLDGNGIFLLYNRNFVPFQNCTEDERRVMWESFFVTSPYNAWGTPEPSNNDVNAVLITTVISMLFISIAVVAVRSFGGRE